MAAFVFCGGIYLSTLSVYQGPVLERLPISTEGYWEPLEFSRRKLYLYEELLIHTKEIEQ